MSHEACFKIFIILAFFHCVAGVQQKTGGPFGSNPKLSGNSSGGNISNPQNCGMELVEVDLG